MKISSLIKRIFVDIVAASVVFAMASGTLVAPTVADANSSYPYTKTFTITAYYSPLPCQDYYVTGSLSGDKRLNGNGVAGADGTAVFPGMIAAPKTYDFGTKMYIPGVGTASVHDRGGAIVASSGQNGVYDRLDIWMGYGDIGLARALQWGKRNVEVTVFGQDESIQEVITLTPTFTAAEATPDCEGKESLEMPEVIKTEAPKPEAEKVEPDPVQTTAVSSVLSRGDSGDAVVALQNELRALNYLRTEPTGVYDEVTEHAVYKFQQSQLLVGNTSSPGAGIFGPKTKAALDLIANRRIETKKLIAEANSVDEMSFSDGFGLAREMNFGENSSDVRILQKFLADRGYFEHGAFTNFFGSVTRDALIAFQIEYGIVSSASDTGAGRVGPKTLEVINSLI